MHSKRITFSLRESLIHSKLYSAIWHDTQHIHSTHTVYTQHTHSVYTAWSTHTDTHIHIVIHRDTLRKLKRKLTYTHRLLRRFCARSFWANKSRQGPPLYGGVYTLSCVTLCGVGKGRNKAPAYAKVHGGSLIYIFEILRGSQRSLWYVLGCYAAKNLARSHAVLDC